MSSKRRDSKNRILEKGEFQREDGRYEFKYKDRLGKRRTVYSWKLVPTDRVPMGKKCDLSLREMEQKINSFLVHLIIMILLQIFILLIVIYQIQFII